MNIQSVQTRLEAWAEARGIPVDADGYVTEFSDNFFVDLSPETLQEFSEGDGTELGGEGTRGKIQALHSSSALACNFFEYWRQRDDRTVLKHALGLNSEIAEVRFESPFPTGLRGTSPHLDVVLETDEGLVAIESKFLEPYRKTRPGPSFSGAYFPPIRELWTEVGLPQCQEMAAAIFEGSIHFEYLNAPQLLKHALGLWKSRPQAVRLWYLWFDLGGDSGA